MKNPTNKALQGKNIALNGFGYWPKPPRRPFYRKLLKPLGKIVIIANLALVGIVGCTDMGFNKELIKAAVDGAIDASFEHGFAPDQMKYFVASTAAKLFQYGLDASWRMLHGE